MANIHQTLKRVASLYEDLIGTREETHQVRPGVAAIGRRKTAPGARGCRRRFRAALKDVERLGRAVKRQREEIEVLASEARERWGLVYIFLTLAVTMSSLLLMRAWNWLFPGW